MFLELQDLKINNIAPPPTWWDYFLTIMLAGIILIIVLTPTIIFINILKRKIVVEKSKFNTGKILITTGLSILALEYLFQLIIETIVFIAIETSWDPEFYFYDILDRYSRYSMILFGLLIIFSFLGFSYLIINIKDRERQKKIVLSFIPFGLYFVFDFFLRFMYIKKDYHQFGYFQIFRLFPIILFCLFIPIFIYSINMNKTKTLKRVILPIIFAIITPFLYLYEFHLIFYSPYLIDQFGLLYDLSPIIIFCSMLILTIYTIIHVNLLKIEDNNFELVEDNSLLEAEDDDNSSAKIMSEEVKADI
ncbi:MAG TPA: hypothetical protein VMZ29_14310 [Candidatus Bathyarchaeia archaeon]|nr:hypothetical protein [Candidatus Bathyarchaeia archaeon]